MNILHKVKQMIAPLTISEALALVKSQYDKKSKARYWHNTPIRLLCKILECEKQGIPVNRTTFTKIALIEVDENSYGFPITAVTYEHIERWEFYVDNAPNERSPRPRSEHTKNSYKRAMRAFWNKLVHLKHVDRSPADILTFGGLPPHEPKHLTDDQVQRLLDAASQSVRDYAMVQVLRSSGIRLAGLIGLTMDDLRIDKEAIPLEELPEEVRPLVEAAQKAGSLEVIQPEYRERYVGELLVTEKGKRGRKQSRYAFLDHEACAALLDYIKTRPHDAPTNLWLTPGGDRGLVEGSAYQAFKRIAVRAGVDASPHDLRHTFAFNLIENGVDPKRAALLLGHRDPLTTMRVYYNPRKEDLRKTFDQLRRNKR